MRLSQVVRSGPNQYIGEAGALRYLKEKISGFSHPVVITGVQSYEAFCRHADAPPACPVLRYDGSASNEDMERLAAQCGGADVVIGIGGGRALDTAKGTAQLLHCATVTIPTVAGTCSAYTPLSAVYHPDHTFKDVQYYDRSALLTLVDYNLLLDSPKEYLIGGICDTLAKWYEARGITKNMEHPLPAMVETGLKTSLVTKEVLLRDTAEALRAAESGTLNSAFERVIDTVIGVAGTVGGFAGEAGRMAGAHAVHNALSLFPETHEIKHGVKVAYGILVQLCAEGDEKEAASLIPYYKENGFIYSFGGLNVRMPFEQAVKKIAAFAAADQETFNLAVPGITADGIVAAMKQVEALGGA